MLAGAEVSVPMAEGAEVAHRSAGFVVTGGAIGRIVQALAVARTTHRIVFQNLGWALACNLLAIAAAGMLIAIGALTLAAPWLEAVPSLHAALAALGCRTALPG